MCARVPPHRYPSEGTIAFEPLQGAEPIFLHVLRPMIKPYTYTLDMLLDGGSMFGDFIFLAASIPVRRVRDQWDSWTNGQADTAEEDGPEEKSAAQKPEDVVPQFLRQPTNGARPAAKRKGSSTSSTSSIRSAASQRTSANSQRAPAKTQRPSAKSAFVPITANANAPPAARTSRASRIYREPSQSAQPPPPPYERWVPPASAYTERGQSGLPTPPADSPPPFAAVQAEIAAAEAEWRQYPDFPAAYPPTPLQTTSPSLPGGLVAPVPLRAPQFARIAEESGDSDEEEGGATVRRGFQTSRPLPREFTNPDFAGDLSDDHAPNGVHGKEVFSDDMDTDAHGDEDVSIDDSDSQEGESEDDFGMSLRTPRRMRVRPKTQDGTIRARKNIYGGGANLSDESLASTSTKLSTTDNGSSLRTNSVASQASSRQSSIAPSDTSSIAGRKGRIMPVAAQRTHSSGGTANRDPAGPTIAKREPKSRKPGQQPQPERVKKAKAAGARPTAVQLQTRMRTRDELESEGEGAEATDGELSDPGVAETGRKRKQTVRPKTRREDSDRTLRPRKTGAANATGSDIATRTNSQTSVRGRR